MRKAKDPNLVERYYFFRTPREVDDKGRKLGKLPIVAICLIKDNDNIARGISVCSLSEFPNKIRGRGFARKYALKALIKESDSEEVLREESWESLSYAMDGDEMRKMFIDDNEAEQFVKYKSQFNPKLYPFEERLFYRE